MICCLFFGCLTLPAKAQTYSQWLTENNLPADASGTGALLAAPAGDGIPNLLKFGLGLTPGVKKKGGVYSGDTVGWSQGRAVVSVCLWTNSSELFGNYVVASTRTPNGSISMKESAVFPETSSTAAIFPMSAEPIVEV